MANSFQEPRGYFKCSSGPWYSVPWTRQHPRLIACGPLPASIWHGNVSQGCTGSLAQLQQHETYNKTSEPFLSGRALLDECTNKPRARFSFYTDITAPLSNVLQKVVKSRPSPWSRVWFSQAVQSGHASSLWVKAGVRTVFTLPFGDRTAPAADCTVRLETSSNRAKISCGKT